MLSLEFPSGDSLRNCQGSTVPLDQTGGQRCWTEGEDLVKTFTGTIPAGASFTRTRLQFRMDDHTDPPTVNTFNVEINGVVIGSHSTIGNGANPTLRTLDLTFDHAPIVGPDVTLRIVATSTVGGGWARGSGSPAAPSRSFRRWTTSAVTARRI